MSDDSNSEIIRSESFQIQRASAQLLIANKIIALSDPFFKRLADISTIRKAIDLAKYSRLNRDSYFDPNEMESYDAGRIESKILDRFRSGRIVMSEYIYFELPKTKTENRKAYYIPFEEYVIRFILGIVLFDIHKRHLYLNAFGGKEELLSDKKGNSFNEFKNWQTRITQKKEYNYLICLDIRKYFDSINHEHLIEIILSRIAIVEGSYFLKLLRSCVNFSFKKIDANFVTIQSAQSGIIVGSAIDGLFQNILFQYIDEIMNGIPEIAYARLTDDIKIFCRNKNDGDNAIEVIATELKKIGLVLNEQKTKWFDLLTEQIPNPEYYIELDSQFEMVFDSEIQPEIFYTVDENGKTVFAQYVFNSNYEIANWDKFDKLKIEDGSYAFNYFTFLLSKDPKLIGETQIDNMVLIIQTKLGSTKLCNFFINSFYRVSTQLHIKKCAIETLKLLSDKQLNEYYRYSILRALFLDQDSYYFKILSADKSFKNAVKEQLIVFSTSNDYIIRNTVEFLIKKYFKD